MGASKVEPEGCIPYSTVGQERGMRATQTAPAALRFPDLCNPLPAYARGTSEERLFNAVFIEDPQARRVQA